MFKWASWFARAQRDASPSVDQFVGAKLHSMRVNSGESIGTVGSVVSLPAKQVERIEAGKKRLSALQLFVLARHFNVPVAAFFDRRGDLA
jgi:hypothetical protein